MTTWILALIMIVAVTAWGIYLTRKPKQKQQ